MGTKFIIMARGEDWKKVGFNSKPSQTDRMGIVSLVLKDDTKKTNDTSNRERDYGKLKPEEEEMLKEIDSPRSKRKLRSLFQSKKRN